MAPVFAHGQLRLYLLSLLEDGPRHGYELITALSDRFGGTYRPSAGTVYPRLSRLEEEGLVRRTDSGRKTVYTLTDAGRAEVDAHRAELAALEHELADTARRLAAQVRQDVTGAMAAMRADLAAAAQDARAAAGRATAGAATGAAAAASAVSDAVSDAVSHAVAHAASSGTAGGASSGAAGAWRDGRAGEGGRRELRARRIAAEAELTRFREDVRAALRVAEARGELSTLTAETIRTVLSSARAAISATLPR